jgi:hypothetical protein
MALSTIQNNSFADTAVHGRRNLIINGAMQVAQRGTSTSSVSTSIYGACDRQKYYRAGAIDETVVTVSQSTDAPTGFKYSHKVQVTTAEASIDSDDLICPLHYIIEGQDLQHLSYGTSSAKAMTVSFWVRSNVTGVFSLSVYNNNSARLVAPTYTISSADTWEYKTLAIPGDQTGTIVNTNGYGLDLYFNAMVGSSFTSGTSAANAWAAYTGSSVWCVGHTAVWGSSTSDYWQITGVQLEVGETATPFEHRSYGEELSLCLRYFNRAEESGGGTYAWAFPIAGASQVFRRLNYIFPVPMRTTPSLLNGVAGVAGGSVTDVTVESGNTRSTVVNIDLDSASDTAYSWFQEGDFSAEL